MSDSEKELVALTQKLLDSISSGDWVTYADLCDPSLTAIEAEAPGQVVVGLDFHKFYFDLGGVRGRHRTTMSNTAVRLMGDAAVVTYARLVQRVDGDGKPVTSTGMETRVWQKREGRWRHVHFHRTPM